VAKCSCRSHGTFLTAKGLAEAEQRYSLEGLASRDSGEYVDRVGSVSASTVALIHWDDGVLDQQYRRFLNGS